MECHRADASAASTEALPDFDGWWDYSDPAGSESRFLSLMPRLEGLSDPGPLVELLTQVARAQGIQQRFEDAEATLHRARALARAATPRANVRVLLEAGRIEHGSGRPGVGEASFRAALAAAESIGEEALAVDAAHMLGIVTSPSEQIAWNLRAIGMAGGSRDPKARAWLGTLYANLASTYQDLGQLDEALALFHAAEAWARHHGSKGRHRKARWRVARCLRLRGRTEEALAIQMALAEEDRAAGKEDGYVLQELGQLLLARGEGNAAVGLLRKALEIFARDPWRLSEAEIEELSRLERAAAHTSTEVST